MKQILNLWKPELGFWIVFILLCIPTATVKAGNKDNAAPDGIWEKERREAVELCISPTEGQKKTLQVLSKIVGIKETQPTIRFCGELYFNLSFKKVLNLSKIDIKDISPLKSLKNLEWLDLSYTEVTDITPLRNLTNLKVLHLDSVKIRTIRPLIRMKEIRELNLKGTDILNIRPISYLTDLRVLYLNNTRIRDIRSLKKLTNLEHIYLDRTNINDITPLKKLQKLTWLGLYKTTLMDCSPKNLMELAGKKECIIKQTPKIIVSELLLDIKEQMALDNIDIEIYKNNTLRIKNDQFNFSSSQYKLTAKQKKIIRILGPALQENLVWNNRIQSLEKIVIAGYTDSRKFKTKSKGNQKLSLDRALASWEALNEYASEWDCFKKMKNASGKPLFEMVGRSDSNPIVKESEVTEKIRMNRRVDFVFHSL